MGPVRVLIVADDPLARAGLATLLANVSDILVVERISSADDLALAAETHHPDVLLWDMGWRPEAGLARLAEAQTRIPVVALLEDEADALHARRAGARGLLRRDSAPSKMTAALLAAAENLLVLDPDFLAAVTPQQPPEPPAPQFAGDEPPLLEELTPRELEVLRLLAEGLPNKTIAQRLDISEHTVKFHVNSLLGKLSVASRTEAVVRATRLGLIFL